MRPCRHVRKTAVAQLRQFCEKTMNGYEAIKHYRQALDINPVLAEAHANLGDALRVKKNVEGAMMHYQKFLGINPKSVRAHDAIGALLHNEKDVTGIPKKGIGKLLNNGWPGKAISYGF
jgi:tetratricopeptide (TPR) repeat protein